MDAANKNRSAQRGIFSIEATFGAIVFMLMASFVFNFSMGAYRQATLVNLTLKTAQQVSRDAQAATDPQALKDRAEEIFNGLVNLPAHPERSGIDFTALDVDCQTQQVRVRASWSIPCPVCVLTNFKLKMFASNIGLLEVPEGSLQC